MFGWWYARFCGACRGQKKNRERLRHYVGTFGVCTWSELGPRVPIGESKILGFEAKSEEKKGGGGQPRKIITHETNNRSA